MQGIELNRGLIVNDKRCTQKNVIVLYVAGAYCGELYFAIHFAYDHVL